MILIFYAVNITIVQLQVTIQVTDNGKPNPRTDNKLVIINVPRDKNTPTIANLPATVNISEGVQVDQAIFTVNGRDADKPVSMILSFVL